MCAHRLMEKSREVSRSPSDSDRPELSGNRERSSSLPCYLRVTVSTGFMREISSHEDSIKDTGSQLHSLLLQYWSVAEILDTALQTRRAVSLLCSL